MKALIYENPRVMNIREVPKPVPKEHEVLICIESAGICGSELGGYLGHNSLRKPPLIMGHEFTGTIVETGGQANRFQNGDRVTANPLVTCGECTYCRSGRAHLCVSRKLLGAHLAGAYAEYIAVPEQNVCLLPDNVSFDEGAFVEPFACAIHTCRQIGLTPEDRLIIFGAGPIGLFALQAASIYGVTGITVIDLNPDRLEIAKELGAAETSTPGSFVHEGRFDAAVDAVGAQATRFASVRAVRNGGRVAFSGLHEAESMLPVNDIVRSEITMFGSFAYSPYDFELALRWIGEGKIQLLPWTLKEPLERGAECFERLITNPGKIAKILLSPK